MLHLADLRREFPPLLRLAWPLVLGEFGWMTMSLVDTIMVGRVSNEAMGGVSVGSTLFYAVVVLGIGILFCLDALVAQAHGAGRESDCQRWLRDGLFLCFPLTPLLMGGCWMLVLLLKPLGVQPAVLDQSIAYLNALIWSTFPLLVYSAARRYLHGIGLGKPVMICLLSANIVNLVACWVFIFGHWGFPGMGVAGAGWATCVARFYMAIVLLAYILWRDKRHSTGLRLIERTPDLARIRQLIIFGFPAGMQIVAEVGVFALMTALLGRLQPHYLAAHQVALSAVSYTFMVPMGIGSAAAVRVGQALGRGDRPAARTAGWASMCLGAGFMSCSGLLFMIAPGLVTRLFTSDPSVLDAARSVLAAGGAFQIFDGLQGVATGALRGAGETRIAAISHFCGYWFIGLPAGYYLCFIAGWNVTGMWIGICMALMAISYLLTTVWWRKTRNW